MMQLNYESKKLHTLVNRLCTQYYPGCFSSSIPVVVYGEYRSRNFIFCVLIGSFCGNVVEEMYRSYVVIAVDLRVEKNEDTCKSEVLDPI